MGRLTIDELIGHLKRAKLSAHVAFDFCNLNPSTIGSWRGIYAEPALSWKGDSSCRAVTLIAELESAISGRTYDGWKGGHYTYKGHQELHVDNPGQCTYTYISHVTISRGMWVTLHTIKEDDD